MSDLEMIRDSLSEFNNSSKEFLISALIEMDQELTRVENVRDQYHEAHNATRIRADLHARRCEIALAILRDDEAGLSYNRLNQLADVIWPGQKSTDDPTAKPTPPISQDQSQLAELLHLGLMTFRELMKVIPVGSTSRVVTCDECGHEQSLFVQFFELGGLKSQIESFQLRAKELLNKLYGRIYD